MADMSQTPQSDKNVETTSQTKPKSPPRLPLNKLYALPAPLRTFPLPILVPHNPISLFHILYVWLSQAIKPPSSNFDPIYQGWWSPDTRSVHVTDTRSIRGLWEQGFYGKGSLSRSEPNWLNREKTRRGTGSKLTSEQVTQQRRVERQHTKWERARKEREAIDQRLLEEAEAVQPLQEVSASTADSTLTDEDLRDVNDTSLTISDVNGHFTTHLPMTLPSPVGPRELLSLPNSHLDLDLYFQINNASVKNTSAEAELDRWFCPAPVGPMQLLALPNTLSELPHTEISPMEIKDHVGIKTGSYSNGHVTATKAIEGPASDAKSNGTGTGAMNGFGVNGHASKALEHRGSELSDETVEGSVHSEDSTQTVSFTPNGPALTNGNGSSGIPKIKRRKSVRFSPTVEKTTFIQSEPPSPERANGTTTPIEVEEHIQDREHYQLTMEEAFFLSYSLGALSVLDPLTKTSITNEDLFNIFRKASYFPPVSNPSLSPDDPFMLNYVVYHHYRSLGWCVRGGAKFSCDFMLYNRGPVFSHAEFAIIILPSYSDDYWSSDVFLQNYVKGKEHRTWAWMHCINRVITQVKKSLVLVYVDIPRPLHSDEEKRLGVDGMIQRYQVREFVMKRWQMNRERADNKRKS